MRRAARVARVESVSTCKDRIDNSPAAKIMRQPINSQQKTDPLSEIFASEAPALRRAGFAVLPAHGKEPKRKGFTKWPHAPSLRTVVEWAENDPTADIVYVPGLCSTERGDAIIVVDADDAEASGRIEEMFGRTPGKVKTRRGKHALYRDGGSALGKLSSLKKFGVNADIKHGRSIVVAPPSRHETGTMNYAWEGCDPSVIRDLPVFNVAALQDLVDCRSPGWDSGPNVTNTAPPPSPVGRLRDNSRGLGLNDLLCKHAWAVETRDELLDVARTINQDYPAPIHDDEVVKRTNAVWKDLNGGSWNVGSAVPPMRARAQTRSNTLARSGRTVAMPSCC